MYRIRELRENLKLSRQNFAEKLKVSPKTIQNWESGVTVPDLANIVKTFNVSADWLLCGMSGKILPKGTNAFSIPYYRHVTPSAGTGIEIFEEVQDGTFDIPPAMFGLQKEKGIVILYASGDSMHPYIKDGDGMLVNLNERVITAEATYVLRWRDALLVKDVQLIENGIRLISKNPAYKPIELTRENTDDVQVVGRVLGGFYRN
jgi:SOS-response transcriptional repressor LexA